MQTFLRPFPKFLVDMLPIIIGDGLMLTYTCLNNALYQIDVNCISIKLFCNKNKDPNLNQIRRILTKEDGVKNWSK